MAMREQNLGRAAELTQAQIHDLVAQDPAALKETTTTLMTVPLTLWGWLWHTEGPSRPSCVTS